MTIRYRSLGILLFLGQLTGCGDDGGSDASNAGGSATSGGKSGVASSGGSAGNGGSSAGGSTSASGGSAGSNTGSGGTTQAGAGGTSTAGSNGDGGTASAPPQNVLPCDSISEVGKWDEITPPGLMTGPVATVFDPIDSGTMYLGTGDGCDWGHCDGVFKTTDCGSTWAKVNTGTLGSDLDQGDQWTMEIDFLDPKTIYTNSGYGTLGFYRSTNSGVDWTNVTPAVDNAPGFISRSSMDPEDPKHILVDWHEDCTGGGGCVHETTDGGDTWKGIQEDGWGGQTNVYVLHGSTWLVAPGEGLARTTDAGVTWTSVYDGVAGGHSAGRLYRAKDGSFFIGTTGGIIYSAPEDDGASWSLIPNTGSWTFGVVGDGDVENGETFYANSGGVGGFIVSTDGGVIWTKMAGESPHHSDGCGAQYEPGHDLLISSCGIDGIHRMKTK